MRKLSLATLATLVVSLSAVPAIGYAQGPAQLLRRCLSYCDGDYHHLKLAEGNPAGVFLPWIEAG